MKVYDLVNDRELKYKIVGNLESDPSNGHISIDTPIAKALIGKNEVKLLKWLLHQEKLNLK